MIAIKDLESLKTLGVILVIPFFSAAYIIDGARETIQDPVINWLHTSPYLIVRIGGWALWLLLVVAIVVIIFLLIDNVIVWLHVKTESEILMACVGFACLTGGVFIFAHVFPKIPPSPLNPFWHLGLLVYGYSLVERAFRS